MELASHAFFSPQWFNVLGPKHGPTGSAFRQAVKSFTPVAVDATATCWAAVEQQAAAGDPGLLEATRTLCGALFEGLRSMGSRSAEILSDSQQPREIRSFHGVNVLWLSLTHLMTTLPPAAVQQLLGGSAVPSLLRSLLGYLVTELRLLEQDMLGGDNPTNTAPAQRIKVSRFWLQHVNKLAQYHPAAAAAVWDDLVATASEAYRTLAALAAAAGPPLSDGHDSQQEQSQQTQLSQLVKELDAYVVSRLALLMSTLLEVAGGEGADGRSMDEGREHHDLASARDIEARLAAFETLAARGVSDGSSAVQPSSSCGPLLAALALLQRSAHAGPAGRAALVSRTLPWAARSVAVEQYDMALTYIGPAAADPCVDLTIQLAAAALSLLAVAGGAQAQAEASAGQDADTLTACLATLCHWAACGHPLLSTTAVDTLTAFLQRCQPELVTRLLAAVARLTVLGAGADALAGTAEGRDAAGTCVGGAGTRMSRLLGLMLSAAEPGIASEAWRGMAEAHGLQRLCAGPHGPAEQRAGLDALSLAAARALWAAASGAAAASSDGAGMRGIGGGSNQARTVLVQEQELGGRMQWLNTTARQVWQSTQKCSSSAHGAFAAASGNSGTVHPAARTIAEQLLLQLLGCLDVSVAHARQMGAAALQPLAADAGGLAVEVLQVLTATLPGPQGHNQPHSSAHLQLAAAALRLLRRTADAVPPAAVMAAAVPLTRLAELGRPDMASDVAVVAAYCNAPPPEPLFHSLLRNPHAVVLHEAIQSQLTVCRTTPAHYRPALRGLLPPADGGGPPSPHWAPLLKSYQARRVSPEELQSPAAAAAFSRQRRTEEGTRLASAASSACMADPALGRPAAPAAMRQAVQRGVEALQSNLAALSLANRQAAANAAEAAGHDPMVSDRPAGPHGVSTGGGPSGQGPLTGQLSGVIAEDNTAVVGLGAALGTLERCLGALAQAARQQGLGSGGQGRQAEWDQLQAHAKALLGDLSSATSRLRNMNNLLYSLQGR